MNDSSLSQNIELIQQGLDLLRSLPAEAYNQEPPAESPAPALGPHIRHCLDFYLCFLDGLKANVIDYGSRSRRRDVETDAGTAIRELEVIQQRLAKLDTSRLGESVELRRDIGEGEAQQFGSTVGRELQFLLGHTVHHYALIAIGLRLEGVPVPDEFGVAPSTLEHWRREGRVGS